MIQDQLMPLCSDLALKDTTAPQALPCPTNTLAPQAPSTQDRPLTALPTACNVLLDSTVLLWDLRSQQVRKAKAVLLACQTVLQMCLITVLDNNGLSSL